MIAILEAIKIIAEDTLNLIVAKLLTLIPEIIVSLGVLILGIQLANLVVVYSRVGVYKTFRREALVRTILRLMRVGVFLSTLFIILAILDVNLSAIFISAGIAGVVMGVILAPLISSFLSGIFILSDKAFDVGDKIEILNTSPAIIGYVTSIGIRTTRIKTVEGNLVVLPNNVLLNKDIINYTAEYPELNIRLPICISYESDIDKAKGIMIKASKETKGVKKRGYLTFGPYAFPLEPIVLISGFGENGLDLTLSVWLGDPHAPRFRASEIYEKIYKEFQKNNIVIPYPRREFISKESKKEGKAKKRGKNPPFAKKRGGR